MTLQREEGDCLSSSTHGGYSSQLLERGRSWMWICWMTHSSVNPSFTRCRTRAEPRARTLGLWWLWCKEAGWEVCARASECVGVSYLKRGFLSKRIRAVHSPLEGECYKSTGTLSGRRETGQRSRWGKTRRRRGREKSRPGLPTAQPPLD